LLLSTAADVSSQEDSIASIKFGLLKQRNFEGLKSIRNQKRKYQKRT